MKKIKRFICLSLSLLFVLLAWNSYAQNKEVGVQLYSVRGDLGHDATDAKFAAMLEKLAKMGYTYVEAAGYNDGKFYGVSPEEFKAIVEKAGLQVRSSHCMHGLSREEMDARDFSNALAWWDQAIAAHKAAGMSYIVTPWIDVPKNLKDLETYCLYLNAVGKRCQEAGIQYGYHNHSHEFNKIEGETVMLDYMIEHTDPAYMLFELDVYWAVIGKASPVDYFHKYPGRFKLLHIKDHREIGQSGMVGFDAIFKNTSVAGVEGYFVEVEQFSTSSEQGMKESIDYLLKAPFVKKTYSKKM